MNSDDGKLKNLENGPGREGFYTEAAEGPEREKARFKG